MRPIDLVKEKKCTFCNYMGEPGKEYVCTLVMVPRDAGANEPCLVSDYRECPIVSDTISKL